MRSRRERRLVAVRLLTYVVISMKRYLLTFGLLLFSILCVPFAHRFWRLATFSSQRGAGIELIDSLESERPSNIPKESWEIAVNWTRTAYLNVFSSIDNSTADNIEEFNRHARDVKTELSGFSAIEELWEGLSRTGPYGQQYVEEFYPGFRRCYDASISQT